MGFLGEFLGELKFVSACFLEVLAEEARRFIDAIPVNGLASLSIYHPPFPLHKYPQPQTKLRGPESFSENLFLIGLKNLSKRKGSPSQATGAPRNSMCPPPT